MKAKLLFNFVLAGVLCLVAGCTVGTYVKASPQAHFVYPNSNVTPLGPVKVTMAGPGGFMTLPMPTSQMESELVGKAIAQVNGANLLTDYVYQMKVTVIPLWFINIYTSRLDLEGSAAKMEVGRQELR
jgi:hypothetical protein